MGRRKPPEVRIGFAGLGRMGTPMARRLASQGYELVLWNRTLDKAWSLAEELGCESVESPRALALSTDTVITMLADDRSSEAVHEGPQGLFAGTATRFIAMGTLSLEHIQWLVAHAPQGTQIIDAPVSGATQAAQAGQLMIMAGCTAQALEPLQTLFDCLGAQTICLETTGAGAVMKLAVNAMIHGINQTLAEAMTLAEAAGIPAEKAFEVIEASAACAPMLTYRRPLYLDEQAHEVTFTVALARKDMAVTTALAQKLGVAMPQGQVTFNKLCDAEAAGFASRDMASILNLMREENA